MKNCKTCKEKIFQTKGRKIYCKICIQNRNKERVRLHAEKLRENPKIRKELCEAVKQYAAKARLEVLTHYCKGKPRCQCSGCKTVFLGFLQIDHINGGGEKQRNKNKIYGSSLIRYLKKHNFPKGYQVFCANCNSLGGKGIKKECPMKGKTH